MDRATVLNGYIQGGNLEINITQCVYKQLWFYFVVFFSRLYPVDKSRVDDALSMDEHVDSSQEKKNM